MGSPCGGRNGRRCAAEVEVGSDSERYEDNNYGYNCGASRHHYGRTDELHCDERLAGGEGHDESVHERGGQADEQYGEEQSAEDDDRDEGTDTWDNDREFEDRSEDDRVRGSGVFTRAEGGEYHEQYDNDLERCCGARSKGYRVPTGIEGAEQGAEQVQDDYPQHVRRTAGRPYRC